MQGARRPALLPGDRRTRPPPGHGSASADAAHLRQRRPCRPDPPAGRDARPPDPRPRERTAIAVVALPEEMPVNETAALEGALASEVGVVVDRIFCAEAQASPSGSTRPRSSGSPPRPRGRSRPRGRAAGRRAHPEPPGARPAPATRPARGELRGAGEHGPVPLFSCKLGVEQTSTLAEHVRRDGRRRRPPRGQATRVCAARAGRQDDHLGGDRRRDGGRGK